MTRNESPKVGIASSWCKVLLGMRTLVCAVFGEMLRNFGWHLARQQSFSRETMPEFSSLETRCHKTLGWCRKSLTDILVDFGRDFVRLWWRSHVSRSRFLRDYGKDVVTLRHICWFVNIFLKFEIDFILKQILLFYACYNDAGTYKV